MPLLVKGMVKELKSRLKGLITLVRNAVDSAIGIIYR
jgi:hypothetical protein